MHQETDHDDLIMTQDYSSSSVKDEVDHRQSMGTKRQMNDVIGSNQLC